MPANHLTLATKTRQNITHLFVLLGDAATPERAHRIVQQRRLSAETTAQQQDQDQRPLEHLRQTGKN